MPNTASAKKRLRQNDKRHIENRSIKRLMNTLLKKVTASAESGDIAKSEEEFRTATKKIDQAAAKGVIHTNAAARLKSRYSKKIKEAKQSQ